MTNLKGMKCSLCGSTDVTHDALVRWSNDAQEWETSSTLDSNDCDECGNEECVEEYELTGKELADALYSRRLAGIDEFVAMLHRPLKDDGAIAHLVLPDLIEQACAIRAKLYQYAATMAEQDEIAAKAVKS